MSDPRFARFKTDPRFRRIKKDQSKVVVDERFKGVFEGQKKAKGKKSKGRVDKYGRPLADTHETDNLRRFYRLENEGEEGEPVEPEAPKVVDYARGAVLLESSDEEDLGDDDDESDTASVVALGRDVSRPIPVPDELEIDLDEDTYADLDAQAVAYSKSHPEDTVRNNQANHTRRLAVVNLDWDHVRAIHLYKIFSSLVTPTASSDHKSKSSATPVVRGKILSVRVYPSKFGKERMAREEKEGPPPELYKSHSRGEQEINERTIYETGDGDDYDEDMLRKYQLERLRYYYAIVECDTVEAASHLYTELDGTELERSANVLDLSFVPEVMTFDDEFRDEATGDVDAPFTALEFVTDALRHSRVKLTWDEDDHQRNLVTRRTLTKKEIEENDFRAYIASSSSESEAEDDSGKRGKSSATRDKLRSLLLEDHNDALPEGWGKDAEDGSDVDMEITFTPGLSGDKDTDRDETTLEKYQRKMKEKRKRKKEAVKGGVPSKQESKLEHDDDFFAEPSDEGEGSADAAPSVKKGGKRRDSAAEEGKGRTVATAEELALLAATDGLNKEGKHFDMKAILKAEKGVKGKRKKGKHQKGEEKELQDDFKMDVKDPRFSAVHEDHAFAIDPSNPRFKKTKSMTALLDERSKRQREKAETTSAKRSSANKDDADESHTDLMRLVESVKRKSAVADSGSAKRRKN